MIERSKLPNQALCFGNFLVLIRNCGGQAKPCGGRVSACKTHLCHLGNEAEHLLLREECDTTKTPSMLTYSFLRTFRKLRDRIPKCMEGKGASPSLCTPTTRRPWPPVTHPPPENRYHQLRDYSWIQGWW